MSVTTVGLDIAKTVFHVHGVDVRGAAVISKRLRRAEVVRFFAKLAPALVGLEACGGAHHWERKLATLGLSVYLIAPQFVKPYVKSNKNDARDAEAICEAVSRPSMRFVPVKSVEQQAILGLHRARQAFVYARTAQSNQIRGLLAEFGFAIPKGMRSLQQKIPEILADADNSLVGVSRELINRLLNHLRELEQHIREHERRIVADNATTRTASAWKPSLASGRSARR